MKELMSEMDYSSLRTTMKDCIYKVLSSVESDSVSGIPSGFQPLDELTDGFEPGKVYVVGGRPCMGREEFMLSMIINIILESKKHVLLFSTNNTKSDYVERLMSIHCDIPTMLLHQGVMEMPEWERLDKGVGELARAPLFIHDSLNLSTNELVGTVRNCFKEERIHIIFIDCLQMIDFNNGEENTSERIAKVMFSLKQLACQANLPIVVGSMQSRAIENREGIEGRRPQLTDLANSSYIEELADVVMMVHRPEYYHIFQDDNGRDFHGRMEVLVKKNAFKPLGGFCLNFKQETGVVSPMSRKSMSAPNTATLKELEMDNRAVKKLVNLLDLEVDLPF